MEEPGAPAPGRVEIITPIETEPWGERYLQMADPNGIVYQLVQWITPPAQV